MKRHWGALAPSVLLPRATACPSLERTTQVAQRAVAHADAQTGEVAPPSRGMRRRGRSAAHAQASSVETLKSPASVAQREGEERQITA